MGYPRFSVSRRIAFATKTSGNTSIDQNVWTAVDTSLDLTIPGEELDVIEVGVNMGLGNEAVDSYFDAATIVSAAPVNWVGSSAGNVSNNGLIGWAATASLYQYRSGGAYYQLTSGDVSDGFTTVRLMYRNASATSRTLYSSTVSPFQWYVKNHGPEYS